MNPGEYLVVAEFNTDANNQPIPEGEPPAVCLFGPFPSLEGATLWMSYGYPDDDTDLYDMYAVDHTVAGQLGYADDGVTVNDPATALGSCAWFALCPNDATSVIAHPVLGGVPVCDSCRAKAEAE